MPRVASEGRREKRSGRTDVRTPEHDARERNQQERAHDAGRQLPHWRRALEHIPDHTGSHRHHLEGANATLGTDLLRDSVRLPPGVHKERWIARLFKEMLESANETRLVTEEVCTCPTMCAGRHVQYAWPDGDNPNPSPFKTTANQYAVKCMEYGYKIFMDPNIVPLDHDDFPPNFMDLVRSVHRRLFRIYAHTYIHHFDYYREGGAEAHLNTSFKHFLYFVREFDIVSETEMSPLREIIAIFDANGPSRAQLRNPFHWIPDCPLRVDPYDFKKGHIYVG